MTHLFLSDEPIEFGRKLPLKCLCGKILSRAAPEMMQELTGRGLPEFRPLRDCSRCIREAESRVYADHKKVYLYAIAEGEEQKMAESV